MGLRGFTENNAQYDAIRTALSNPMTKIWGPPGTGKTTTICAIAALYHRETYKLGEAGHTIMIVAHSNAAADVAALKLESMGVVVPIRYYARKLDYSQSKAKHLHASKFVESIHSKHPLYGKVKEYLDADFGFSQNGVGLNKRYHKFFSYCPVIVVTSIVGSALIHRGLKCSMIAIDEAGQMNLPETLGVLIGNHKYLVVAGDEKQIGVYVDNFENTKNGYQRSILDIMTTRNTNCVFLNEQYRMHEEIMDFPNKQFYQGKLKAGCDGSTNYLNTNTRAMFFDLHLGEEKKDLAKSYKNEAEVQLIINNLVRIMEYEVIKTEDITILTPYSAQRNLLKKELEKIKLNVHVSSVDGFQGQENKVIFLSCVRANKQRKIGFLGTSTRLNVMLTRAKDYLFVVGNKDTLSGGDDGDEESKDFRALLSHLKLTESELT